MKLSIWTGDSFRVARRALFLVLAAVAVNAAAAPPNQIPPGMGKYVMVLWEAGSPLPDGSPGQIRKFPEPNLASYGGTLLSKSDNRRVVLMPLGRAKELRRHEAVAYLQRLWMGESVEGWDETDSLPATGLSPKVESDTNLQWGPKAYTYDGSGNIKTIGPDSFTYDTAGRLIQSTIGTKTESFKYDAFGNLIEKAIDGGAVVAIPVDGGSNRMVGPAYDAAGNVITDKNRRAIVYDSLNMMTEVQPPVGMGGPVRRILYDANDERIGTLIDTSLTRWTIRDFDGQIVREFKGDGENYWMWVEDHIRAGGVLVAGETQPFFYSPNTFAGGGHRHYHLDHLGSVRMVTNDAHRSVSEHDYYAFGTARTASFQEEINAGDNHVDGMRFAGHWRDFMGLQNVENSDYLDYMHARYYDPNRGRFLSVDPTWSSADLGRPQSWNRYSYVLNNPVKTTDPDGRCPPCAAAIGEAGLLYGTYYIASHPELAQEAVESLIGFGALVMSIGESKPHLVEGVYEFPDAKEPGKTYVGQSEDTDRRLAEHEGTGKKDTETEAKVKEVPGGKTAREHAEQNRLNELGGKRSVQDSQTSNKVNPIGPKRQSEVEKLYGKIKPPAPKVIPDQ